MFNPFLNSIHFDVQGFSHFFIVIPKIVQYAMASKNFKNIK